MEPKILIVGTVPYNTKSTSRAFDAYFHGWEKDNLAQIFSNTKMPCKGHCGTLYQITDYRMLQRWLGRKIETGKIFYYEQLNFAWKDNDLELDNALAAKAYKAGQQHSALTHLLRGILWRKKFWCTPQLQEWLDAFKPDCVFLSFSDDYFIPQIAYFVAQYYNIPIISSIGDDYYFNKHFSLNPIYQLYKETYKALIRKVLHRQGSAIYISDKIRDKYNKVFSLNGETVYLTSTVQRKSFAPANIKKPLITYFGNIRMGRNHSLNAIGIALGQINPHYKLEVYSNEHDPSVYKELQDNPNIVFGGSIPYADVKKKMTDSDVTIIVEGFAPSEVELSRYSLSTKAADALASGTAIFVYGSQECGIVEYMKSTHAAMVCTECSRLEASIRTLLTDVKLQQSYYEQEIVITQQHHNLESSTKVFRSVVEGAIRDYAEH